MSFLSSSRPTLPPIRDVFRDEFSLKVPSNSQPLTLARPWSGDVQEAKPSPIQRPPPSRCPAPEFRGTPHSALLHDSRLNAERMGPLVQAGLSNPSSKYSYQALQQSYPFSAKPRYLRTVSPSTEAEDTEIFERTPGGYNSDPLLASTRSPSFAHGVQHEKRNNYECSYCGKIFNRPSSLKIHSNSHTGEKPFACPVQDCGRSFSVLSNMRRHARCHTVSPAEPTSDHCPILLSSTSLNLGPPSLTQSHRRYNGFTSSSTGISRICHF